MFGFKEHTCKTCGSTRELSDISIPIYKGVTDTEWYCKAHCLNALQEIFLNFSARMIVSHPIVNDPWLYAYYDLRDYWVCDLSKEDARATEQIIASMPAGAECAYYNADATRTSYLPNTTFATPSRLPLNAVEYLSKKETWGRIYPTLSACPHAFKNQLYAPYGSDGFFGSA